MNLLDLLRPEHMLVPLRAPTLRAAAELLVDRLEQAEGVRPSADLRQRLRTDPLRDGLAVSEDAVILHYRTGAADGLTLALGVSPERIPAGEPGLEVEPRVVALVLAPQEAASLYLQATSTLARVLREPGVVDAITRQADAAGIVALDELEGHRIQPSLTVRDIMVHRVHSVPPETTVRRTLDLMLRRRLHAVPVVAEKGEVLGMITDSDLMRALLPHIPRAGEEYANPGQHPGDRPVRDIMTRSVLCVSEDLGVNEVASMMINKDVEQVPVVHAGTITGMVARSDIIRKLFGRT